MKELGNNEQALLKVAQEIGPLPQMEQGSVRVKPEYEDVLAAGADHCRALARETMGYVKEKMGLI